jgi:hypothetical protein
MDHADEDDGETHFLNSTLRERIVEHVFVGELLRRLWQRGITDVEVLRAEFDAGGYDLVLARGKVIRHVQFKTMRVGGSAKSVKLGLKLADKPSGCVLWIVLSPALEFDHFLWFGAAPGLPLPDIQSLKVARHTKGNAAGVKLERLGHRVIPLGRFTRLDTMDGVIGKLFGDI